MMEITRVDCVIAAVLFAAVLCTMVAVPFDMSALIVLALFALARIGDVFERRRP